MLNALKKIQWINWDFCYFSHEKNNMNTQLIFFKKVSFTGIFKRFNSLKNRNDQLMSISQRNLSWEIAARKTVCLKRPNISGTLKVPYVKVITCICHDGPPVLRGQIHVWYLMGNGLVFEDRFNCTEEVNKTTFLLINCDQSFYSQSQFILLFLWCSSISSLLTCISNITPQYPLNQKPLYLQILHLGVNIGRRAEHYLSLHQWRWYRKLSLYLEVNPTKKNISLNLMNYLRLPNV